MQLNCCLSIYVYTFKHGLLSILVPEAFVCIGKQSMHRYTAGENAETMRPSLQTKLAICINTLPRRLWEHRGRDGGNNVRIGLCREDCEVFCMQHGDCTHKRTTAMIVWTRSREHFVFAYIRYVIQVSLLVEDLWIVHNCCGKGETFLLENVDNGRFLILHLVAPTQAHTGNTNLTYWVI